MLAAWNRWHRQGVDLRGPGLSMPLPTALASPSPCGGEPRISRVRSWKPAVRRAVPAACLMWLVPAATVWADQIVVGKANYPGAKIMTLDEGQLRFRTADGELQSVWISDVDLLIVDRGGAFADFNQAERYLAGGEPEKAIARYRRTLRLSETFWSDLILARLLLASDRAGRIDQAALSFVLVVRGESSGPAVAARLIPEAIPAVRNAKAVRAIEHLDAALDQTPRADQRVPLEFFRYELLRRIGDKRAADAAKRVASMVIPEAQRCERVYVIQLAALEQTPPEEIGPDELAGLDRAIRDCPTTLLPSFLLLKGHVLARIATTPEEIVRASWPFMRVVAHMPDDPRAADGLYGAALILGRLGRNDQAVELLNECLTHKHVRDETRQAANAALQRLKSAGDPAG